MKRYLSLILLTAVALFSLCSCRIIPPPKEKTVESIVAGIVPEAAHCVSVRDEKEYVYYTFKSDLRDFTFEVVAIQNEGGLGYKERVEYSKAVREHYNIGGSPSEIDIKANKKPMKKVAKAAEEAPAAEAPEKKASED